MNNGNITLQAVSLFGLESVTADELGRLGYKSVETGTGRVTFQAALSDIPKVNICLRTAERVLLYMGGGFVRSFTELFDTVKALPWEDIIPADGAFPVKGHSLQSILHSIPDCQAIIKKAIVERLKLKYKTEWFNETGERYRIQFAIMKDELSICIDTSGDGLHKRGYRENAGEAPLRETLAAGILLLSRYRGYETLVDPMCGSGTFLIEAGLIAQNRAPGLMRTFDSEKWGIIPAEAWREARRTSVEAIRSLPCYLHGYDSDEAMVQLTLENAGKAGLSNLISVQVKNAADINGHYNVLVTNPPYGERMGDKKAAGIAARLIGRVNSDRKYVITSDEKFEYYCGHRADKKRKLYNGMIKCDLYMYFNSGKPSADDGAKQSN